MILPAERKAAFSAAAKKIGEFPISILATSHGTEPACQCVDGRVQRPAGLIEACGGCRTHEVAWKPYHDELRRLWLLKQSQKKP